MLWLLAALWLCFFCGPLAHSLAPPHNKQTHAHPWTTATACKADKQISKRLWTTKMTSSTPSNDVAFQVWLAFHAHQPFHTHALRFFPLVVTSAAAHGAPCCCLFRTAQSCMLNAWLLLGRTPLASVGRPRTDRSVHAPFGLVRVHRCVLQRGEFLRVYARVRTRVRTRVPLSLFNPCAIHALCFFFCFWFGLLRFRGD